MPSRLYRVAQIPYSKLANGRTTSGSEYHIIPAKGNDHVVYFPLKGICALVNNDFVNNIDKQDKLVKTFFDKVKARPSVTRPRVKIKDNVLFLFPTSACNLKCIYCFASGGDRPRFMKWSVARTAIKYKVSRCKSNTFYLVFHGGGEPTLAFEMMKKATEYAQKLCKRKGIKLKLECVTNGTLTTDQIRWFSKVGMFVLLSFDGPPDVQNAQRPFRTGRPSYRYVARAVRLFNKLGIEFIAGATITEQSGTKLINILKHFHRLGVKNIALSLVRKCGRAEATDTSPPMDKKFIEDYFNSDLSADRLGINLVSDSGIRRLALRSTWCHGAGRLFAVTADGDISSCAGVTDRTDPASKALFYGKISGQKVFVDEKKLGCLRARTRSSIPECKTCFVSQLCCGGCLAESYHRNESIFKPERTFCDFRRAYVKSLLMRHLYPSQKM